jgi:hypothetical protein
MNKREIKFRVWDKERKYYSTEYSLYCANGVIYNGNYIDGTGKRFTAQQFTGLLDVNGQDIYEGDILKFGDLNYVVDWIDYKWTASCPYYNKYHWPRFEYFSREARCSTIVGNIFENPELIKNNE